MTSLAPGRIGHDEERLTAPCQLDRDNQGCIYLKDNLIERAAKLVLHQLHQLRFANSINGCVDVRFLSASDIAQYA